MISKLSIIIVKTRYATVSKINIFDQETEIEYFH